MPFLVSVRSIALINTVIVIWMYIFFIEEGFYA